MTPPCPHANRPQALAREAPPTRPRAMAYAFVASALGLLVLLPENTINAAEREPLLVLGVSMSTATSNGERVVEDAWIDGQWAVVDRLYAEAGIRFQRQRGAALPETLAHLETREDRDALHEHAKDGVINVFFVKSLRDIDEPERMRRGVCWRSRFDPPRRYVAVSSISGPSVLAHELGHYLGNAHSKVPDNVMSYERTGGPVFFDPPQKKTLRRTAVQLLRDGVLRPADS
jgi:hypothetical protein